MGLIFFLLATHSEAFLWRITAYILGGLICLWHTNLGWIPAWCCWVLFSSVSEGCPDFSPQRNFTLWNSITHPAVFLKYETKAWMLQKMYNKYQCFLREVKDLESGDWRMLSHGLSQGHTSPVMSLPAHSAVRCCTALFCHGLLCSLQLFSKKTHKNMKKRRNSMASFLLARKKRTPKPVRIL